MAKAGFDCLFEQVKQDFICLCGTTPVPVVEAKLPKCPGVYVFHEGGSPRRVGTTKNLRQRVKQHYGKNHRSAAFAKRLARCETGIKGGTRPGEGWKTQVKNPDQKLNSAFEEARERIRKMSVTWLAVPCAETRYLLEFYAARELRTPYNDFSET